MPSPNLFNLVQPGANAPTPTPAPAPAPTALPSQAVPGTQDDSSFKGSVRLHAGYSRINENLSQLFQSLGVPQTLNVPFIHGEATENHVQSIAAAAHSSGGSMVKTFLVPHHRANGRGWASGDGSTHGYSVDALQKTVIPKDSKDAVAAISATRAYLRDIASLLPDDPSVKQAQEQLKIIAHSDGQGMHAFDFGTALQQIVIQPTAAVARAHSMAHPDGPSPAPRLPHGTPAGNQEQEPPAAPQNEEN